MLTWVYWLVSIANCMKSEVAGTIGPVLCQPYVLMAGGGLPPGAVVSPASRSPLPTLIAAVDTLEAFVRAAGEGGGLTVKPASVHCAIFNPQTALGPGGAVLTVTESLALSPVARVAMTR